MNSSKFFLSTLIAAAAMTATVYAENGDTVKINFNADAGKSADAGWTDTTVASNSNRELSDSAGNTMKANWSAHALWNAGNTEMGILNGYLDDNNNGTNAEILVGVTGISYLCYDVTIYCSADTAGSFSAKTVNGVTYTYDSEAERTVIGESSWGAGSAAGTTPIEGKNCLTVSLLAGDLSISSLGDNVGNDATGKARGNIAAIEIVDTSVAYDFALSGTSLGWNSSSLGVSEWKNASALNGGSYANFSIEGDTVINVSETIDTVAIFTTGTGKLTLAGESPINMVAASKIGADSGTSIEIQNAVNFSNGGTISGAVSTSGSGVINVSGGTLVVTDALSAGNVAPSVSVSLSNDSAVSFDISKAGTNADLSKISGGADTRIKLKASGTPDTFSTITSLGADFYGSVEVTGGYLKLDSEDLILKLAPVKSVVLSGGSSSGLVFLRAEDLVFDKDIVAEENGGGTSILWSQ